MRKTTKLRQLTLPKTLPIMVQNGKILLRGSTLHLSIKRQEQVDLVNDVLVGKTRLIGIVQPMLGLLNNNGAAQNACLYNIGTAGRLIAFEEYDDGELDITLAGICRFRICKELNPKKGYRQAEILWDEFVLDMLICDQELKCEKEKTSETIKETLMVAMQRYFDAKEITVDWNHITSNSMDSLVNALSMVCPFEPAEKQALLEAGTLDDRFNLLLSLAEIHAAGRGMPIQRH